MNAAAPHRLATNMPGETAKEYAYKSDSTRETEATRTEGKNTRANRQQSDKSKERTLHRLNPKVASLYGEQ